jgi:transcriptional regulator with XRE-family HTH domain
MKKKLIKTKEFKEKIQLGLFLMGIGDAIYKARKKMNLRQDELAEKTFTTQRIISQIENADSYNMGAKMLFKLFKFLKIQMIIDGYDAITGKKVRIENIQILDGDVFTSNCAAFTIKVEDLCRDSVGEYSLNLR